MWRGTAALFIFASMLVSRTIQGSAGEPQVDYLRDIKPLLKRSCYRCHGAAKQTSGLRLDTARATLSGSDFGEAIVPGESGESLLYLVVSGSKDYQQMPPAGEGEPLTSEEVVLIQRWIDSGAKFHDHQQSDDSGSDHWSFQKPERPAVPAIKNSAWVRNEIDAFVLARLEEKQISPSPEADRVTLIRRLSFDLLGLPPTPEEVSQFLADKKPNAYEKLVDRLLASPHYGERWGRHWLDAARYADSNGYGFDSARNMWRYRDWVINALNADMPFDQFTIEQIAGDMLPGATRDQIIATGFHRNSLINEEGGADQEQFRIDAVADRLHTTGAVWLGLTLECARCHTHRYDPITQREYYEMFAFFNADDDYDLNFPPPPDMAEEFQKKLDKFDGELAELDRKIAAVYGTPAETNGELKKLMNERTRKMWIKPRSPAGWAMVMQHREQPRITRVHKRGNFLDQGDIVAGSVPAVLPQLPEAEAHNRLDFARWLVDENNPLTPRVTVNRMWQHYFGTGIVETENDFGAQGERPSHPQLLDWLASEFIARSWSMKAMHKLIVTSATYRQSSHYRPEVAKIDPANRLLARQSRLRLDAEIIR
ncbi:PSD1 and planctomycete cytochrome C domain-containing protein, partial [Symmachiella dynata]|uniref:PSD1 and planctomycete cytochrome C domain-containing protein n=1 Tax=Symmachiella dynata TaxID=2527995 RepID=UPI0030ED2B3A